LLRADALPPDGAGVGVGVVLAEAPPLRDGVAVGVAVAWAAAPATVLDGVTVGVGVGVEVGWAALTDGSGEPGAAPSGRTCQVRLKQTKDAIRTNLTFIDTPSAPALAGRHSAC
jgi:hypothetical protein